MAPLFKRPEHGAEQSHKEHKEATQPVEQSRVSDGALRRPTSETAEPNSDITAARRRLEQIPPEGGIRVLPESDKIHPSDIQGNMIVPEKIVLIEQLLDELGVPTDINFTGTAYAWNGGQWKTIRKVDSEIFEKWNAFVEVNNANAGGRRSHIKDVTQLSNTGEILRGLLHRRKELGGSKAPAKPMPKPSIWGSLFSKNKK